MTSWDHLLTDSVTYAPLTGQSGFGDPTWGANVAVDARVDHKATKVVGTDGNVVNADHVVVSTDEIPLESKVWLPGDTVGNDEQARRPLGKKKASIPGGDTVHELFL